MSDLWPIQRKAIDGVVGAIDAGHRRVLLTAPTGTGKTRVVCALIEGYAGLGWHCLVLTNRKLLIEQLTGVLADHGIVHGVRAAGYADERELPVQIASLQTEVSRTLGGRWALHGKHRQCLVVVDEAHLHKGPTAQELLCRHHDLGHVVLGVTATPIGLGALYDHLIVAGTTSEGRACGALVPAYHYGPDEPDLKSIGRVALGEDLSESQNRRAIMTPTIAGRVLEWYGRLNPSHKPTILFAPGVAESLWFAERFEEAGVAAAHIDGEEVWVRGSVSTSGPASRERLLDSIRSGGVKVVCNRFVLREGIDLPEVEHMIFACVFGSLQTYLQSGGRGLRGNASTGKARVTVQDHGGNWWRHGSLNADREWNLDATPGVLAGLREERLRAKEEAEPVRCPKCGMILAGVKCPCGFTIDLTRKSRPVIQSDGSIREHRGDVYRPRFTKQEPDTQEKWNRCYFRARAAGMTFRQAEGLFFTENGYFPPRTLFRMPTDPKDLFRQVAEVPREGLR